jgi:outer membrane protein insertion porin family/translocation and assembly module TamA
VSHAIARDRTDNLFAPTHGDQIRLEIRHASSAIGSDPSLEFNKALASASVYFPIGADAVLAFRAQGGAVFEPGSFDGASGFVPPQERLYAGGPSSVRGFNQNELGPVVYIVSRIDSTLVSLPQGGTQMVYSASADSGFRRASPTGGNTLLVGNTELRMRSPILPRLLDWVGFMDVGYVYNRGSESFNFADLKWTPGMGVRVTSPVGPLRLDVAYNGYPRRAGPAFFVDPLVEGSSEPRLLRCVSPGNTLDRGVGTLCPPTFSPTQSRTFFSRLVFHFSIGQAF